MKTKFESAPFRVKAGENVNLLRRATRGKPAYKSKGHYHELLEARVKELSLLQCLHYADNRHAVLLILQGMDAAGKDGVIRHVMSRVNPQGCQVFSFKPPSTEERAHDFLWRTNYRLPERGRIGIFNRSYYEEVLVMRVHPELLVGEGIPPASPDKKSFWPQRCRSIVDMEAHLHRNGTRIVKIFLHQSKEEQRKRFLARIDDPKKNWKFSQADIAERQHWNSYREAYEACLTATSTADAPWHVVPADDKRNARLIVAGIMVNLFKNLNLAYPKTSPQRKRELQVIRNTLTK